MRWSGNKAREVEKPTEISVNDAATMLVMLGPKHTKMLPLTGTGEPKSAGLLSPCQLIGHSFA